MGKKNVPVVEFPGRGRAVIEPARLAGRRAAIPPACVLCFFPEVLRERHRSGDLALVDELGGEHDPLPVYRRGRGRGAIGVARAGVGAPFSALVLEQLIAMGGRMFIACGGAGVLDAGIEAGRVVLATAALRDEGTSYHYLRPARSVRPHRRALAALRTACRRRGIRPVEGMVWTTDAAFRETPRQVRRRREEGCVAVEMEAAALFAVARFRRVALGEVLYAADDVSGREWKPRGWTRRHTAREGLFEMACEACRRLAAGRD